MLSGQHVNCVINKMIKDEYTLSKTEAKYLIYLGAYTNWNDSH